MKKSDALIFVVFFQFWSFARATDYLIAVMASNEQGFVKEVGECSAAGANFGLTIFGEDSLTGCFVPASPADGCSPLAPPPMENGSLRCIGGFFAVASRENCSFAQKAYRAQGSNYRGLIVYNFVGYNFPIEMGTDTKFGPHVRIPAFMVGYDCGSAVLRSFTFEKGFAFLVRVYWSYHDLLRYMVPFVIVVGICFAVMLSAMFIKCVRDRRREMRRRLTKRHLKQIPTKKYVKGEGPETCPICLDDFEENEKLRILPCSHAYHCRCIDPWLLKTRRVCPICKRKVLPGRDDSSESEADDQYGGPSRLASASERTPLLVSDDYDRTVGNSTFYGTAEQLHDDGSPSAGGSQTLDRVRPILLSPVSTPDLDDQPMSANPTEEFPPSTQDQLDRDQSQTNGGASPPEGHVNPSFVADARPNVSTVSDSLSHCNV